MNLMLDLETFSTQPDAAVFEVAIVPFDQDRAYEDDALHVTFMPTTGHMDPGTVVWWLRRADVCALQNGAAMSESDAASRIYNYLRTRQDNTLWAMPTSFDCIILEQLLHRNGHDPKLPIDFRQWRDLRTMRQAAGWPEVLAPPGHVGHSAKHDALRQITTLQACWKELAK